MDKDLLLEKIKQAGIVGRGGGGFPSHLKWKRILDHQADKKVLVCNASEGEPGVFKDFYILKNYPEKVFKGIRIALDFLDSKDAYINFNKAYYHQLRDKIDPLVQNYKDKGCDIRIFIEEPSYIGGETGALLNAIEGKRTEPRLKPPSPSLAGIRGNPCLVHNVETLYDVCLVVDGKFKEKRYYSISGEVRNSGVYHLNRDLNMEEVLKKTNNWPDMDFFVQAGGGASGPCFNKEQLKKEKTPGSGSIEVYPADTHPREMFKKWFTFYKKESCGKCGPCRQGTYQLYKMINQREQIPWKDMGEIIEAMEKTAFCALGTSIAIPYKSYLTNVLKKCVL